MSLHLSVYFLIHTILLTYPFNFSPRNKIPAKVDQNLCQDMGPRYEKIFQGKVILFARSQPTNPCSKCLSVMGLTKSAPDTGLRVTPMIPPRNSLAVGWFATCTVVSPQKQWSTRPCGGNLHDSAVVLRRAPQVHYTCLRRERAPARSLVSRNLHGPGGVATCTVVSPQ